MKKRKKLTKKLSKKELENLKRLDNQLLEIKNLPENRDATWTDMLTRGPKKRWGKRGSDGKDS